MGYNKYITEYVKPDKYFYVRRNLKKKDQRIIK